MSNDAKKKYSILIVCLGNICRSPMAEALLKKELAARFCDSVDFEITSAGFLHNGEPASQPAEELMFDWGMDISRHLSTRITRKLVSRQDLILTMEEEQADRLKELNEPGPHIESIISYASQGKKKGDIHDPYGQSKKRYEDVANSLKLLVKEVANVLSNVLLL